MFGIEIDEAESAVRKLANGLEHLVIVPTEGFR